MEGNEYRVALYSPDSGDESFAFLSAYFRVYADFESPEAERDFLFTTCIPLNHNICNWGRQPAV